MKIFIILLGVVIASVSSSRLINEKLNAQWEEFKAKHGKSYSTSEDETARSVDQFADILTLIIFSTAILKTFEMGKQFEVHRFSQQRGRFR
jgi:hypothetical protein